IMTAEIEYATQPTIQVLGCRDMNSVQVEARIVQVGKKVRVTAKNLNLGRRLLGCCGDREEQNQGEQKTSLLHHQFLQLFVTVRQLHLTFVDGAPVSAKYRSELPRLPACPPTPSGDAPERP